MNTPSDERTASQRVRPARSLRVWTALLVGGGPIVLFVIFAITSARITERRFAAFQDQITESRHEVLHATDVSSQREEALEVALSPLIYRHGWDVRREMLFVAAVFALIFAVIGVTVVEWSVLRPLAALDRELGGLSLADDKIGTLKAQRNDEIGRLVRSINRLLRRVHAARRRSLRQEELLSGVLNSTLETVMALECVRNPAGEITDLRIVLINRCGEEMLGVSEGELIGRTLRDAYPKLVKAGIYDRWIRVAVTREPGTFEAYYEGDAVTGWFRNSIAPWEDGVVVTVTNITDRKTHEHELAETLAELERFNAAMIGREERILEMKREVNTLRAKLGLPEIYEIDVKES